jgi:hypothetical protein
MGGFSRWKDLCGLGLRIALREYLSADWKAEKFITLKKRSYNSIDSSPLFLYTRRGKIDFETNILIRR